MILIDSNVLLYATLRELSHHTRAKVWLEGVMNSHQPIALSWTVLLAVLRISTHPRLLTQPLTVEQALGLIDGWLEHPLVQLVEPGPAHWGILRTLIAEAGTAANLSTDAHLGAGDRARMHAPLGGQRLQAVPRSALLRPPSLSARRNRSLLTSR